MSEFVLNDTSLLADVKAPKINGVAAQRLLANETLRAYYQGLIEKDGKGITENFSRDTAAAQIRVLRVKPLDVNVRRLGSKINGANFNGAGDQNPVTVEQGIDILDVIDRTFSVANISEDLIPVDLLQKSIDNYNGKVTRIINGATIAVKLSAALTSGSAPTTYNATDGAAIRRSYTTANSILDLGDEENDVDVFPDDDRVYQINPVFKNDLQQAALFTLSDTAQKMFADGQMSPGDSMTKLNNGFLGNIYGVAAHYAATAAWKVAEDYLGLPYGSLTDGIVAFVSSGMGTSRGIATAESFKIVDTRGGQGKEVQPLIRFGLACWYPKSVQLITRDDFVNPITTLKRYDGSYNSLVIAGASRQWSNPVFSLSGSTVTATDSNVYSGAKHFYAYTKDATCKPTVAGFDSAYAASGAKKGEYTSGTALPAPTSSGTYYALAMTISKDGSVCVVKSAPIVVA